MDLPPALFQFLGSLVAILALAAIAWAIKLGPERRLESREEALEAAEEAVSGFGAVALALDADGRGALLRDAQGRILLLRPHGTHFAGRILTAAARARLEGDALVIDTAEKRYGTARLRVDDADAWMQAIEAIEG
ncbi:hypothetical protein [Qipengyuania gaetbuli]|uniref:hypothetical protein n=1 Tax=Qipengyuania gaetbuli TaxID=266952 RepID=UPI001CD4E9C1|nr:hypothetical protein [Qipengyuania gaetbuli]MCA0910304.1 hypothetical protein [Qipengyuania gaetbuli]